MYADSIKTLAEHHLGLRDLNLVLNKEWASPVEYSRLKLRRFIFENVLADESLLDLNDKPARSNISISHHKELGGFASSENSSALGFDMELNERARPDLVARVSVSKHEFDAAPNPCALWTAKEAAFKCLSRSTQSPLGVADIEIGKWRCVEDGVFLCEIISVNNEAPSLNLGLVITDPKQSMALFVLNPPITSREKPCAGY